MIVLATQKLAGAAPFSFGQPASDSPHNQAQTDWLAQIQVDCLDLGLGALRGTANMLLGLASQAS